MEIYKIENDLMYVLCKDELAVGDNIKVTARDTELDVVAQVLRLSTFQMSGIESEVAQRMLERETLIETLYDDEQGIDSISHMKIAVARIRLSIEHDDYYPYTGFIPSRHAEIQ